MQPQLFGGVRHPLLLLLLLLFLCMVFGWG
jgi:hypothetical protein